VSNGAVVPIIRLLPALLRLFPTVRSVPLVRGLVIPVDNIIADSDLQLARKLNRKLDLKKKKQFTDSAHVVKVSDVKAVLEKELDGTLLKDIALALGRTLSSAVGGEEDSAGAIMGNRIMDKIREKILVQTAFRKRVTYRYSKRAI
jgi:hypothetical protein